MNLSILVVLSGCCLIGAMQSSANAGTVSGRVSYPSEYIPPDMKVCAETVAGSIVNCVRAVNKYRLSLPQGRYYIYAQTSEMKGYKAYYTEAVVCSGGHGGTVGCNSHKRVVVEVQSTSVKKNVNPQDWYDQ